MADPENKSLEEKSILIQEKRTLRFCFKGDTPKTVDRTKNAYDFFLELVNPETFPKGTACTTGQPLAVEHFVRRYGSGR